MSFLNPITHTSLSNKNVHDIFNQFSEFTTHIDQYASGKWESYKQE